MLNVPVSTQRVFTNMPSTCDDTLQCPSFNDHVSTIIMTPSLVGLLSFGSGAALCPIMIVMSFELWLWCKPTIQYSCCVRMLYFWLTCGHVHCTVSVLCHSVQLSAGQKLNNPTFLILVICFRLWLTATLSDFSSIKDRMWTFFLMWLVVFNRLLFFGPFVYIVVLV